MRCLPHDGVPRDEKGRPVRSIRCKAVAAPATVSDCMVRYGPAALGGQVHATGSGKGPGRPPDPQAARVLPRRPARHKPGDLPSSALPSGAGGCLRCRVRRGARKARVRGAGASLLCLQEHCACTPFKGRILPERRLIGNFLCLRLFRIPLRLLARPLTRRLPWQKVRCCMSAPPAGAAAPAWIILREHSCWTA